MNMENELNLKSLFRQQLPATLTCRLTIQEKSQVTRLARKYKVSRSEILRASVIQLIIRSNID